MNEIKFIHAADLHLDSPMVGLKHLPKHIFKRLQESTFQALKTLIDKAISSKVDFVILAGDLFDHEDRSIRAQARLRSELERLQSEGISVFIVYGNHDFMGGSWPHLDLPNNVEVFRETVETKTLKTRNGAVVHLYGFSYPSRHVLERKIDDYKRTGNADYHIGILHGNLEGNQEHGNYAPFQLNDLLEKQFDYWALGHIHKRAVLCEEPPIVYPGNLQGRHRKEAEVKGCYLVSLNQANHSLEFIETSDVIWLEKQLDATHMKSFNELYHSCLDLVERVRLDEVGVLLCLKIINVNLDEVTLDDLMKEELLEALQGNEEKEDSFVWTISIQVENQMTYNRDLLAKEDDFYSEMFDMTDNLELLEESLSQLYHHPLARKYLKSLTPEELKQLKQETEWMLLQELLK
ncbi:exonuclease SbcCD subunit D [Cytobacillus sp. FJAT-54145]|uniref:Exonuclease SbcCD subunit D n=1 Tax=Cytobacillus spartinae TaxID=3299023 RepID=A0ABW6K7P0_9BACI